MSIQIFCPFLFGLFWPETCKQKHKGTAFCTAKSSSLVKNNQDRLSRSLRKLILKKRTCQSANSATEKKLPALRKERFRLQRAPSTSFQLCHFPCLFPFWQISLYFTDYIIGIATSSSYLMLQLHCCFSVGHWVVLWIMSGGSADFNREGGGPEGTDPNGVIRSNWNGIVDNFDDMNLKVSSSGHLCLWFWEAISYSAESYYSMY